MVSRQYAAETRRVYGIYISKAEEFCDLSSASPDDLADWLTALPGGTPTRIAARKALILFYRACGTEPNPALKLPRLPEPHRLPRPLSELEHRAWVKSAHDLGGIWEAAGILMATTAARIGEVRTAQWKDFSLTEPGHWRVRGKGARRQGPQWRQQPLPASLVQILNAWHVPGLYVFPGARGPLSDPSMRRVFIDIGEHAGLGYITPHRIRHSCATFALSATGDLRTVQALLGHRSIASTTQYTAVLPDRLRSVVDELPA